MIKEKRIKIPIYNAFLFIGVYDDFEELNKQYNTDATNTTDAVCWSCVNGTAVFFNKNKLKPNVIVHECVHVVNRIFKEKGIDLDIDNDEAQAYLMDYIFEKINISLTKLY